MAGCPSSQQPTRIREVTLESGNWEPSSVVVEFLPLYHMLDVKSIRFLMAVLYICLITFVYRLRQRKRMTKKLLQMWNKKYNS